MIDESTRLDYVQIDSLQIPYTAINGITRSFTVLDGPNTGRLISTGRMSRDIIGTFYNYNVEIDPHRLTTAQYYELYNLLSAPEESHTVKVPYNGGTLTTQAYCTTGEDKLKVSRAIRGVGTRPRSDVQWGVLTVNLIMMAAERT